MDKITQEELLPYKDYINNAIKQSDENAKIAYKHAEEIILYDSNTTI